MADCILSPEGQNKVAVESEEFSSENLFVSHKKIMKERFQVMAKGMAQMSQSVNKIF